MTLASGVSRSTGNRRPHMSSLAPPLVLAGGSLIFLVFIVVFFFAMVYGFYTRKGSGIDQHPIGAGKADRPGVGQRSSRISSGEGDSEG